MRYTLLILAAVLSLSLSGETILTTTLIDGSTNAWTQADLVDALGLVNRKYHRDMETERGRNAWHGKNIGQYLLTNEQTRVIYVATLYEDGFVYRAVAKPVKATDPEAAAKAKAQAEALIEKARAEYEKTILPPDIAELRARQRAAKTK